MYSRQRLSPAQRCAFACIHVRRDTGGRFGAAHDAARFFQRDVAIPIQVKALEDGLLRQFGGGDLAILIGIVFLEGRIRGVLSERGGGEQEEEERFHEAGAECLVKRRCMTAVA